MAKISKRKWWARGVTGHRIRKVAWGYTAVLDGQQVRSFSEEWTKEDAEAALATRILAQPAPPAPPAPKTLAQVAQEYLDFKRGKGKRSIAQDEQLLKKVKAGVGAETPLVEITAQRIAQYDRDRVSAKSRHGRLVSPSTVNRELAVLRHLLRLAEEWGYLDKVPKIRLAREPEGRLRFLAEDEIPRLLGACEEKRSKSPYLLPIVTVALHAGMRRGEILGLTWERVDFSRGVLQLEQTKNGRRREVPMNQAVYDVLSGLPGPKAEGPVFRKADGRGWESIRTAFERACREAKSDDFRFHDLRHTCASWLVMGGHSLKEVQEILGHREFTMTLRYAHLSPDRLRDAVASLERFSARKAHGATLDSPSAAAASQDSGNVDAPVAQLDRATVS